MIHILAGGGDTHHILAMPGILLAYFIYTEMKMSVCTFRETAISPKSVLLHYVSLKEISVR
jgi:hypothetical protein